MNINFTVFNEARSRSAITIVDKDDARKEETLSIGSEKVYRLPEDDSGFVIRPTTTERATITVRSELSNAGGHAIAIVVLDGANQDAIIGPHNLPRGNAVRIQLAGEQFVAVGQQPDQSKGMSTAKDSTELAFPDPPVVADEREPELQIADAAGVEESAVFDKPADQVDTAAAVKPPASPTGKGKAKKKK